ncbi:MAG: ADP-dependent NAD(P)H-hydrate dehydratase / NAD(P)H-hydrate epimerase [Blastocatellia bacterium]|jgi:NAD(P)H-hydrate epimerase|nr:ADP-dependent NAD(P)H-hydrate dehydratase / NAD(P)H-hydrate epimerase [Blastocatellia bacterium]
MREIDRLTVAEHNLSSLQLMETAGTAVASAVSASLGGSVGEKRILTLCGPGNNGGDGAVAARALALMGARVDVVLFGVVGATKSDARINFEVLRELAADENCFAGTTGVLTLTECGSLDEWHALLHSQLDHTYEVFIDALFGTGLRRPLEGVHRAVVDYLSEVRGTTAPNREPQKALVVSIDIPSGLNSDTAEPMGGAVRADLTVTMTAPKPGNVLPPACSYNGELIVADIGSPGHLLGAAGSQLFVVEESDAREWLVRTRYTPESYKNTHGHALIIAGSRGFTGAAVLCGSAALRSGAGLVTIATPVSAQSAIAASAMPEIMTAALPETDRGAVSDEALEFALRLSTKATVVAVGPGLSSEDERTRIFVRSLIERRSCPVVIDADGLNALAPWPPALIGSENEPLILTPHHGEMLRLVGTQDKSALTDRVAAARSFATAHHVIVVLKGARTLISAPDGRVFVNPTGNAGLGTAGAGDTLTGLIAGFLAQAFARKGPQISALDAVLAAVYVGGLAGDLAAQGLGMRTMVASDVRDNFSAAIRSLDPAGELP